MTDMDDENWTGSMSEETTEQPVKAEKPRGKCTGCAFEYTLTTIRSGELKGTQVIRKHNSRTGPGLCSGAYDVPEVEHTEGCTPEARFGPAVCAACDEFRRWADTQTASKTVAGHCVQGACTGCCGCSSMCTTDPCGQPPFNEVPLTEIRLPVGPRPDVVGVAPGGTPIVTAPTDLVGAITVDPFTAPAVGAITLCPSPVDPWTAPAPAPAPAPVTQGPKSDETSLGPWVTATFDSECDGCDGAIWLDSMIRADGKGGWLCEPCGEDAEIVKTSVPYTVSRDRNTCNGGDQSVSAAQVHSGNGVPRVDGVAGRTRLRADQCGGSAGEGAPADVPTLGGGDPGGALDRSPVPESDLRSPGSPGGGDAVGEHATAAGSAGAPQREEDALPQGAPVRREQHPVRVQGGGSGVSALPSGVQPHVPAPTEDPFVSPGAASDIPESVVSVSGQPGPDRDRWGRYVLFGQAHTRATTFAKLGANTKAIEAWNERNVIRGMTLRPDLLMLANGLEVKQDRDQLNSIAAQAKDAAGSKVAANIGTAYHAFSERVDAGLIATLDVPEQYRHRVYQYTDAIKRAGLTTRREWIERTTAVRADQIGAPLPVAGTLDRIFQMPDGSLVIGDLKTGSDLSYGEMEIEVQLALYAHGVNTHGLFDWNTKQWQRTYGQEGTAVPKFLKVRTDIAIVVHLPADGDGCTLYVADIERGWRDAQRLGGLQASLKDKPRGKRFRTLMASDLAPRPAPVVAAPEHVYDDGHGGMWKHPGWLEDCAMPECVAGRTGFQTPGYVEPDRAPNIDHLAPPQPEEVESPVWEHAKHLFSTAPDQAAIAQLYQHAMDSGTFHQDQLAVLVGLGRDRLNALAKRG